MSVQRSAIEIVETALDIDPAEREEWLKSVCAGNAALEAEVRSLLALDPEAAGFLRLPDEPTDEALALTQHGESALAPTGGPLLPGEQLGDFQIKEQIGAGGMGVVYRAHQISLNRDVALKILPTGLRHSTKANNRFRREVEAAARLRHDNIVAVFTMGEENDIPYYAMELIDGPPLNEMIDHLRTNPYPVLNRSTVVERAAVAESTVADAVPDWAIASLGGVRQGESRPAEEVAGPATVTSQPREGYFDAIATRLAEVADGLAYAHRKRVVHRDIKPSNLLLSPTGRWHISDFGLARLLDEPGMTGTGEWVGTAYYMSPEQIAGGKAELDGRTDIYSVGATLYELLTLRPPFIGDSREHVITQILSDEPVPPRRLNRHVPIDLQTICLRALDKEPSRRYQSADEFARDLRAFVSRSPIAAKRQGPITRSWKWARRHQSVAASLAVALCLVFVAIFFALRAYESQQRWAAAQQQEVREQAVLAAMQGDLSKLDEEIEKARQLGAPQGDLWLLEGQRDYYAAKYGDAFNHFFAAANEMPENLAAQCLLALTGMRTHRYSFGEERMPTIRQLTPDRLEDYASLEDFVYRARLENYYDSERAIQLLDAALSKHKTSLVTRLVRADVHLAHAVDRADYEDANAAIADFRIAHELLGPTPIVTRGLIRSHLAAATAYQVAGQTAEREQQLLQASDIAQRLGQEPVSRAAHRLRAFYFDYVGEVENAIAEWRCIEDREIVFLLLTLYREGQYDEALQVCQDYTKDRDPSLMSDFFHAFVTAARAQSPAEVRELFQVNNRLLEPMHHVIVTQTMGGLLGDLEFARAEGIRIRSGANLPTFRNKWYCNLVDYLCGDMTAHQLLETAGTSRRDQCEAHFYVGVHMLGRGDREAGRRHFAASVDSGVYNYFEYFLSQALLRKLERDPAWPPWISTSE